MHPPITPETESRIISALEKDAHASRVARALGDVSYATVWRVAHRNSIALTAGRETMGCRLSEEQRAAVIEAGVQSPMRPKEKSRSKPGSAGQACDGSRAAPAGQGAVSRRGGSCLWHQSHAFHFRR